MSQPAFDYSNLNQRPPGPFVTWASRLVPGVKGVQAQVPTYAQAWQEHNSAALAEVVTDPDGGPLWVVLGDSMAQGIGASSFDRGWPGQLAEQVPALKSHRLVNLSFYGATVPDVVTRQLPAMQGLPVDGGPDLVTVIIGSNDLIGRARRAAMIDTLPKMLAALPTGTVIANQPGGRPATGAYNRQLAATARERDLVVADFNAPGAIAWRGKIAADHFHPNDEGYAAMAGLMADAVRRRLD